MVHHVKVVLHLKECDESRNHLFNGEARQSVFISHHQQLTHLNGRCQLLVFIPSWLQALKKLLGFVHLKDRQDTLCIVHVYKCYWWIKQTPVLLPIALNKLFHIQRFSIRQLNSLHIYNWSLYSLDPPPMVRCRSWCMRGPRAPNSCEGRPLASRRAWSRPISASSVSLSEVRLAVAPPELVAKIEKTSK